MRNLVKSGIALILAGVVVTFFTNFAAKVFHIQWLRLGLDALPHVLEITAAILAFLLTVSAILGIYELISGQPPNLQQLKALSFVLGAFLLVALSNFAGVLLILAPLFTMIRVEDNRLESFFRTISLSIGALGFALVPYAFLYLPLQQVWIILVGIIAVLISFLLLFSAEVAEIVAASTGVISAAVLATNLAYINLSGNIWHILASIGHLLIGLGGVLLIPPATAWTVGLITGTLKSGILMKYDYAGVSQRQYGQRSQDGGESIEVRPFRPTDDDETRVRRGE